MRKIKLLPDHIVSRIAAGEVIERPVYAVKELVENAIDAGADSIQILIEDSGLKRIVVTDNGEGMSKEDLLESFKPHTTSKLIDELIGIKTLGFRGEALASIAAISHLTIQSRTKDEPGGYKVGLQTGELIDEGPVGMPEGTIITVSNLFSSVPARKKFLKSSRTEFRHIVDLITSYALSFPNIRFTLQHNKRIVIYVPKQPLEERIEKLLGKSYAAHFLELQTDPGYITLSGYIAHPQLSSKTTSKQFLFVNNRFVTDKIVSTAAREAYGTLLDSTHYPVFLLFLNLPHEAVDVNIHPRKEQISFINHSLIFDSVKDAIAKTLGENNITFANASFQPFSPSAGSTDTFAADILRESMTPWSVKDEKEVLQTDNVYQLHDTYLITQTKLGMIIIDQHAAHERILFEQFKEAFAKKTALQKAYSLPTPVCIELSLSDLELIGEHMKVFQQLGFTFEIVHHALKVSAIPELFKDRDMPNLLQELLGDLSEGEKQTIDTVSRKMLAFLACRNAINAGERLTEKEAKKLLKKLEETENNATCPHGRPSKIFVPLKNLNKMFKRE